MSLKIYTKTGDAGSTSLLGGTRVLKNDTRIETYGTVDELNSWVGLIGDQLKEFGLGADLLEIQDRLFTIGACLATDNEKENKMKLPALTSRDVEFLENKIDDMTAELPVMKSFILPGGHVTVSSIHVARCVCRRTERLVVSLVEKEYLVDETLIKYLNRLSDYLFTLARFAAFKMNIPETPWKARI